MDHRQIDPATGRAFLQSWLDFPNRSRYFAGCFCSDRDLLSQWRGYGRLGYSIGFDRKALKSLGARTQPGYFLRDMIYSVKEQRARIKTTVAAFLAIFLVSRKRPANARPDPCQTR